MVWVGTAMPGCHTSPVKVSVYGAVTVIGDAGSAM